MKRKSQYSHGKAMSQCEKYTYVVLTRKRDALQTRGKAQVSKCLFGYPWDM